MTWMLAVVLAAGCGDGLGRPDASVPPDDRRGLVAMRYLGDNAVGDNPVYFQNADSSVVLATRTADDGTANAYMEPGGFVTVVVPRGNTRFIYTWAAVQPGDELVIDERSSVTTQDSTLFRLGIPVDPGSTWYQLNSSCGSADVRGAEVAPIWISLDDCHGHADLLVLSIGSQYHYLYREDVAVAPEIEVVFDEPYRGVERTRIDVVNVAPEISELFASQSLIGGGRELFGPQTTGFGQGTIPITDGQGTLDHDMLIPPTGTMMTEVDPGAAAGIGVQHVVQWAAASGQTSIDLGTISLRAYRERASYVPGAHELRWTEATDGVLADAVLAGFTWFRPQLGGNFQWQILAPRTDDPAIALPVLPLATLIPLDGDTLVQPSLLANISIDGGYDRIRARVLGTWTPGRPWPTDGPAGQVVFEDLNPTPF